MSINRIRPDSDVKRINALTIAKDKQASVAPGDSPLTAKTGTRLTTTQPSFILKVAAREAALQAQAESTMLKTTAQDRTRMYISHYFQSFNNGIARGLYPASHRAFYGIDITDGSVPTLASETEVMHWGGKTATGDAARLAAGGAPMAMPTTEEVNDEYLIFKSLVTQQSTLKDAYDNAQEDVGAMRTDVDNLILRIWDEVETAFDDEAPASKRRKAREWGIVYQSTQKSTITGAVTDAVSGLPLTGANVTLLEAEHTVQTNETGNYTMETSFVGLGKFEFSIEGYATQSIEVEIAEGSSIVQNAQLQSL